MPGYHFHFITDDKTKGVHLLEIKGLVVTIAIDTIHSIAIELSHKAAFYKMDATGNANATLEKVEK